MALIMLAYMVFPRLASHLFLLVQLFCLLYRFPRIYHIDLITRNGVSILKLRSFFTYMLCKTFSFNMLYQFPQTKYLLSSGAPLQHSHCSIILCFLSFLNSSSMNSRIVTPFFPQIYHYLYDTLLMHNNSCAVCGCGKVCV